MILYAGAKVLIVTVKSTSLTYVPVISVTVVLVYINYEQNVRG